MPSVDRLARGEEQPLRMPPPPELVAIMQRNIHEFPAAILDALRLEHPEVAATVQRQQIAN